LHLRLAFKCFDFVGLLTAEAKTKR